MKKKKVVILAVVILILCIGSIVGYKQYRENKKQQFIKNNSKPVEVEIIKSSVEETGGLIEQVAVVKITNPNELKAINIKIRVPFYDKYGTLLSSHEITRDEMLPKASEEVTIRGNSITRYDVALGISTEKEWKRSFDKLFINSKKSNENIEISVGEYIFLPGKDYSKLY